MAQRIYRLRDLTTLLGLSKSRIYELIAEGKFPRPLKISDRAVGWPESDIDQFQSSWQRTKAGEGFNTSRKVEV